MAVQAELTGERITEKNLPSVRYYVTGENQADHSVLLHRPMYLDLTEACRANAKMARMVAKVWKSTGTGVYASVCFSLAARWQAAEHPPTITFYPCKLRADGSPIIPVEQETLKLFLQAVSLVLGFSEEMVWDEEMMLNRLKGIEADIQPFTDQFTTKFLLETMLGLKIVSSAVGGYRHAMSPHRFKEIFGYDLYNLSSLTT